MAAFIIHEAWIGGLVGANVITPCEIGGGFGGSLGAFFEFEGAAPCNVSFFGNLGGNGVIGDHPDECLFILGERGWLGALIKPGSIDEEHSVYIIAGCIIFPLIPLMASLVIGGINAAFVFIIDIVIGRKDTNEERFEVGFLEESLSLLKAFLGGLGG